MPTAVRLGLPYVLVLTSACTSTRIGRDPSTQQRTAEPGVPAARSDRNSIDGFGTGNSYNYYSEIGIDPYTNMKEAQTNVVLNSYMDCGVLNPNGFSAGIDFRYY